MTTTEQGPAVPGKTSFLAASAASLTALAAWSLCAAALLALSTFLPDMGSMTALTLVFLAAGAVSFLFTRWAPVREALESLRAGAAPAPGVFGRLLGRLAGLAAVALITLLGARAVWHARLEAAKESLKLKGTPVTLAEFQEDLPDGEYAYPKLGPVIEKEFSPEFYNSIYHPGDSIGRWTPETHKKEAPFAEHYAPFLDRRLAPLLERKYSRYMKVDYTQASREPVSMPEPPLGHFLPIARAAKLCAVSRAWQGDAEKAWRLVRLQFALSDLPAADNIHYSKVVALGLRRVAVETALDVLLNRPSAALPADIARRLKETMGGGLVASGLRSELAWQFDEYAFLARLGATRYMYGGGPFRSVMSDPGQRRPGPGMWAEYAGFALVRLMGVLDINMLATARYFSELTGDAPWTALVAESKLISDEIQRLPSWPYLLVKAALPEFSRMYEREWELKAWAQLALAAAELGRHGRERGRYPKALSELKPKEMSAGLLRDVFTGGDLPYAPDKDGKGYELCSAGAYGKKQDAFGRPLCIRQ